MPYPREIALAKFRVTVVILCGLSIVSVLVYLLTGGSLLTPKAKIYLYVPDATGIALRSPVRVNGIDVGKVDAIGLSGSSDPNRIVKLVLTIDVHDLPSIPVDSAAQITADTMLGDKVIEIDSGREHQTVKAEAELRYQAPTDIMKALDMAQFERQLRLIDAVLTELEEGRTPLGEFVRGEGMYKSLLERTAELHSGIRRAVGTTGQVGSLLYSDALYRQIAAPIRQLDDALAAIESGQGTAGRMMRDTADYDKLREDIASLRRGLATLRQGPGAAADFLNSDAAWNGVSRSVESLIAAVDRIDADPLLATHETYDNLNGMARELAESVRGFRQSPKKYLRIKIF
jgi:phospholipid/cholesterol/gamma-HCH transport system substrate-binding protein